MCGSIKYEGVSKKIGNLITYINGTGNHQAPWLGHSRCENGIPNNAQLVQLQVTSYTEKDVEFQVPAGRMIDAYLIKSAHYPTGEGIFILTRDAQEDELKRCTHPRHPVIGPRRYKRVVTDWPSASSKQRQ